MYVYVYMFNIEMCACVEGGASGYVYVCMGVFFRDLVGWVLLTSLTTIEVIAW